VCELARQSKILAYASKFEIESQVCKRPRNRCPIRGPVAEIENERPSLGSVALNRDGALREKVLVNRFYSAYVALALVPKNEDGSRTVRIARLGAFEVRIVEFINSETCDGLDVWLELYSHNNQSSLDSCRCRDFDQAEFLAEDLICCARDLNDGDLQTSR
jgi:hypothetical protein